MLQNKTLSSPFSRQLITLQTVHLYRYIFCILMVLPGLFVSAQTITFSGYVEDTLNGEKLLGAAVFDTITAKGTTSNVYGFYSLTLPVSDSVTLRISSVGYATKFVRLSGRESQTVNLLMSESNELQEVVVSDRQSIQESTQMGSVDVSMDKVKSLPVLLGETDILKTIQLLPGVQGGTEGSSGMYVRGGGPDQNLILLDGVSVYNASHLFGFFSVFNADAINSVQLIKGGFPARYGGRLSSVLDIRMKEGNIKEFHGEGAIGIISSKLSLEGPIKKEKGSFIVSGRRTYIDLLARPFLIAQNEGIGGYYFYDVNGKANWKFDENNRIYLSTYFGNDLFYYRDSYTEVYQGTEYTSKERSDMGWGNLISALRWNHVFNSKLFANTTATYSRYKFVVGFEMEDIEDDGTKITTDKAAFKYFSGIQDWGIKTDFDYIPVPNHYIRFGIAETYHTFKPGVEEFRIDSEYEKYDTVLGSKNQFAHEWSAFIEDDWKLNKRFKANVGVHYSGFLVSKRYYHSLQPRAAIRILVDDKSSVKAGFSTMTQYIHLLSNSSIGLPTDLWVPATDKVKPQNSWQVAVGYARTLIKGMYELTVEAYYKGMNNLIEYKDGASFFLGGTDWQELIESGRGEAYGLEVLMDKRLGKFTGWIGYTLSWTNRQFQEINFGREYPYRYDRRHDISVAITYKQNKKIDFGLVWVYGTGNAVTLPSQRYIGLDHYIMHLNLPQNAWWGTEIEHIQSRNNYRMPAYHRLDLGVNLHKEKKWGEATWSFGVYNVYNRINPFYIYFQKDENNNTRLYKLGLFPIIPSVSYAFKF